jgi:hypothetical protein
VPHSEQNLRRTGSDERISAGLPRISSKFSAVNVTQATTGAPATRLQLRQWQIMLFVGTSLAR